MSPLIKVIVAVGLFAIFRHVFAFQGVLETVQLFFAVIASAGCTYLLDALMKRSKANKELEVGALGDVASGGMSSITCGLTILLITILNLFVVTFLAFFTIELGPNPLTNWVFIIGCAFVLAFSLRAGLLMTKNEYSAAVSCSAKALPYAFLFMLLVSTAHFFYTNR